MSNNRSNMASVSDQCGFSVIGVMVPRNDQPEGCLAGNFMPVSTEDTSVEYPLPVAEDWEQQVKDANSMAEAIDKHLVFERKLQGTDKLQPLTLCPEQKKSLAADLQHLTGG